MNDPKFLELFEEYAKEIADPKVLLQHHMSNTAPTLGVYCSILAYYLLAVCCGLLTRNFTGMRHNV